MVRSGDVRWIRSPRKVLDEYHPTRQDGEAVQATAPGPPGSRSSTVTKLGDHEMTTSRPTRRARRGTLIRTAGWISAAAMLATAAFAPASVSAADPSAMDVACNNIVNGGRSPEYVWTTIDDAGVTANWAIDAAHFDSANEPTVTIRVCVVDADGADQGAIDQDTENDGIQLFPWSLLGNSANPCPDDTLSFGASADSAAVQTKKSDLIVCPAATDEEPTDSVDQPSDGVDQPSDGVDQPSDAADGPTDGVDEPTDGVDQPTDGADEPTDSVDQPTDSVDQPTGAVEGVVGTPGLTPPPTDTLAAAPATGGDGWRIVLVLIAAALVGTLATTHPRRARVRA